MGTFNLMDTYIRRNIDGCKESFCVGLLYLAKTYGGTNCLLNINVNSHFAIGSAYDLNAQPRPCLTTVPAGSWTMAYWTLNGRPLMAGLFLWNFHKIKLATLIILYIIITSVTNNCNFSFRCLCRRLKYVYTG